MPSSKVREKKVGKDVNDINSKTLSLIVDAVKAGNPAFKPRYHPHHYEHYYNTPARSQFAYVEGNNVPIFQGYAPAKRKVVPVPVGGHNFSLCQGPVGLPIDTATEENLTVKEVLENRTVFSHSEDVASGIHC